MILDLVSTKIKSRVIELSHIADLAIGGLETLGEEIRGDGSAVKANLSRLKEKRGIPSLRWFNCFN